MHSYSFCRFLWSVLVLILIGIPATSRAAASNCISRNIGEIRLGDGSMIPEVSGITRGAPGEVYLVSDQTEWLYHARLSGDRWSVDRYAISSEGSGPNREGIYDIEDVAYGPCPLKSEGQCIFIGEIGGNPRGKNAFEIHYIRERDLTGQRGKYVSTTKIRYRYPGGWKFDAEGLAVHPRTGELFVVTKTRGSVSYIYKIDPRFPEREPMRVVEIDLAALFGNNTNARQITGLEISPDGSKFAVVTYEKLAEFSLNLARVFDREKKSRKLPGNSKFQTRKLLGDWWGTGTDIRRVQVESITYDGSDSNFLIIGENNSAVLALDCTAPTNRLSCGNVEGTWSHVTSNIGCSSSWTLTRKSENDYMAIESGCGNATGNAQMKGRKLRIDWKIDPSCHGYYEWTLNEDCSRCTEGRLVWESNGPVCNGERTTTSCMRK